MARKVTPKVESEEVLDNIQFTKPADTLIEAIQQYSQRIRGVAADDTYIKETVAKIVENRL